MEDNASDRGGQGQELRRLRKSRGLRIADLAARMDRSTGWISQVERGRSRIGYEDLAAFARGFEVPISHLFRHNGDQGPADDRVLRRDLRRSISSIHSGVEVDLLASETRSGVEMYRSVVASQAAAHRPVVRDRLQLGYVESGRIEIWLDGQHHKLVQGDSFRISGETLDWLNPYPDPCTVIWVLAPLVRDNDG